jgi:hypothetical protein
MPYTATKSPLYKHKAAFRSVLEEEVLDEVFFGISAKNLRSHLKMLAVEEIQQLPLAFQQLEAVR